MTLRATPGLVRGVVISIKVGPYLFRKHGVKVVLFSRFIALLRIPAAFWPG